MTKSFKQLPGADRSSATKPVAEQDFFDLLNERPAPVATLAGPPLTIAPVRPKDELLGNPGNTVVPPFTATTGNTGTTAAPSSTSPKKRVRLGNNSRNTGNTSFPAASDMAGTLNNSSNTSNTPGLLAVDPKEAREQEKAARQTFVVGQRHLERLRDHVHARRAQGEYNYSQKEALQRALDLLFAQAPPVADRPESVRDLEQQRGERIRKGRRAAEGKQSQ